MLRCAVVYCGLRGRGQCVYEGGGEGTHLELHLTRRLCSKWACTLPFTTAAETESEPKEDLEQLCASKRRWMSMDSASKPPSSAISYSSYDDDGYSSQSSATEHLQQSSMDSPFIIWGRMYAFPCAARDLSSIRTPKFPRSTTPSNTNNPLRPSSRMSQRTSLPNSPLLVTTETTTSRTIRTTSSPHTVLPLPSQSTHELFLQTISHHHFLPPDSTTQMIYKFSDDSDFHTS